MILFFQVLMVNGIDRAGAAVGRALLLDMVDLLTGPGAQAQQLLQAVSVHLMFDVNPLASDVDCTSNQSNTTMMSGAIEETLLRFIAQEKFAMIVAPSLRSIGVNGMSNSDLKKKYEQQLAAEYLKNFKGEPGKCDRDHGEYSLLKRVAEDFSGSVTLDVGVSCCSADVAQVVESNGAAMVKLLMAARQGIAGVVTSQSGEPLARAVVRLTSSASSSLPQTVAPADA